MTNDAAVLLISIPLTVVVSLAVLGCFMGAMKLICMFDYARTHKYRLTKVWYVDEAPVYRVSRRYKFPFWWAWDKAYDFKRESDAETYIYQLKQPYRPRFF